MKDLYSIQEFAKLTGVEASRLRYWDDIGLFSPIKRNPENNYRYYSITQILTLNFVSVLSDINIPLKTISELRNERDPESFLYLLEKKEREMDMELRSLRLRSSIIHARQEMIRIGLKSDHSQITVAEMEEKAMILWPRNEYQEDDTFIDPLASFINQAESLFINLNFPVGGYHDDMETFLKAPGRPQRFLSLDPVGKHKKEAGQYLVGFTRGYYSEYGDLPQKMATYAQEHDLTFVGPVYIVYLLEEICLQEPSQYLAQISVAVEPTKKRR